MMHYFVAWGDSYAYNLAVHNVEGSPIRPDGLKREIVADFGKNYLVMPSVPLDVWRVFLAYEQKAVHYDYKKSEAQNLQAYNKYNNDSRGVVRMSDELAMRWMLYNEKTRDALLYWQAHYYLQANQSATPYKLVSPDKITKADVKDSWIGYSGKKWDYLFKV